MKPITAALLLAVLAAALVLYLQRQSVEASFDAWLAANAFPRPGVTVAVVEMTRPPSPLDAALILRAAQRFGPKSVAFLDPLSGHEGQALLDAKTGEVKFPVDFALTSRGNGPVENPIVDGWMQRMTFDRLMLRVERAERGEISPDLDTFFRGRAVAVQMTGGTGAAELAASLNKFHETRAPSWVSWIAVILAASLPWWRMSRIHRAMVALCMACAWLLFALTVYAQCQLALPLVGMLVLPILALIPLRLNKIEQRKLPA